MCVSLRKPTHNSELLRHSLHKAGPPLLLVSQFPGIKFDENREPPAQSVSAQAVF